MNTEQIQESTKLRSNPNVFTEENDDRWIESLRIKRPTHILTSATNRFQTSILLEDVRIKRNYLQASICHRTVREGRRLQQIVQSSPCSCCNPDVLVTMTTENKAEI